MKKYRNSNIFYDFIFDMQKLAEERDHLLTQVNEQHAVIKVGIFTSKLVTIICSKLLNIYCIVLS